MKKQKNKQTKKNKKKKTKKKQKKTQKQDIRACVNNKVLTQSALTLSDQVPGAWCLLLHV